MTALVREASAYDVGLFALPGNSRHNEFALPNKFFEYVMAGLALCVSDLPEMARLVRQVRHRRNDFRRRDAGDRPDYQPSRPLRRSTATNAIR